MLCAWCARDPCVCQIDRMTPAQREAAQLAILARYLAKLDRIAHERRQARRPMTVRGHFGNQNRRQTMKKIAVLAALVLLALPALAAAQTPPVLLNPQGVVQFDSPDHASAASYRIGWFKLETDTAPNVAETVPASAVVVRPAGSVPAYQITTQTRPTFARYIVKIILTATTCDPGYCDSAWSDAGAWTVSGSSGTWLGYTPRKVDGFVLR